MGAFIMKNKSVTTEQNEYILFNTATKQKVTMDLTVERAKKLSNFFAAQPISPLEANHRGYFEFEEIKLD